MDWGGRVDLIGYRDQGMGMVVEQTASGILSCQLVVGAEMGGGRARNMPHVPRVYGLGIWAV